MLSCVKLLEQHRLSAAVKKGRVVPEYDSIRFGKKHGILGGRSLQPLAPKRSDGNSCHLGQLLVLRNWILHSTFLFW